MHSDAVKTAPGLAKLVYADFPKPAYAGFVCVSAVSTATTQSFLLVNPIQDSISPGKVLQLRGLQLLAKQGRHRSFALPYLPCCRCQFRVGIQAIDDLMINDSDRHSHHY